MIGPFEMLGERAPVCEDGVCEMSVEAEANDERTHPPAERPNPGQ